MLKLFTFVLALFFKAVGKYTAYILEFLTLFFWFLYIEVYFFNVG